MPTLYSSIIRLTNRYPITLTGDGGQHAHGAFHTIIASVDPDLAKQIHDERKNKRKPFTISPLMGLPHPAQRLEKGKTNNKNVPADFFAKKGYFLHTGWECWLRVTILDDLLFRVFIERFLKSGNQLEIRLGDAKFLVSEILTIPNSHPWAGYTTLEELQKRMDKPAPQRFAFELNTPTSFKLEGKNIETLPKPERVFGSLATAWRELTGTDYVQMIEEYAKENLLFGQVYLQTERTILHGKPQLGSTGRFEYILTDQSNTSAARALNLLAGLAFYSGLGRKTAQGMGQARQIEISPRSKRSTGS